MFQGGLVVYLIENNFYLGGWGGETVYMRNRFSFYFTGNLKQKELKTLSGTYYHLKAPQSYRRGTYIRSIVSPDLTDMLGTIRNERDGD